MVDRKTGLGRGAGWRKLRLAAGAGVAMLWTATATATITQGDFSVFGFFETRESGRWGEGGSPPPARPTTFVPGVAVTQFGLGSGHTGGSFDFNHWDLVQARQIADIRPDYH